MKTFKKALNLNDSRVLPLDEARETIERWVHYGSRFIRDMTGDTFMRDADILCEIADHEDYFREYANSDEEYPSLVNMDSMLDLIDSIVTDYVSDAMKDLKKEAGKGAITICYGQKQIWPSRQDAIDYFWQGAIACLGSAEGERYAAICAQLSLGERVASDMN